MNITRKYNIELEKLSIIKTIEKREFSFSKILLFREYQSRLYNWKLALKFDGNDFFNKRKSYHNLFLDINPPWFNELITEEKLIMDLNNMGLDYFYVGPREYMSLFLTLFVNWEIFKSEKEIKDLSILPHPYETLFILLKRGGLIYRSDNKFVINDITYLKYDNQFVLPSIADNFLDFVDSKCSDFPNQEKVNELWEEYNSL
ncbi:hypothetical protein [Pedobacter montanisoli]|uniref:Uncharacterized protein n=1 Tax=Pedobacter montanisoli TaxID=2923277 RepID=A0ABS9ZXV1_9SPHI|nr:hypothetical protein [Pedobacter montanisoli]MCJ0743114.1 hypothetical protein [Pedobacter montanisoli]